jgi:hypothetical protein
MIKITQSTNITLSISIEFSSHSPFMDFAPVHEHLAGGRDRDACAPVRGCDHLHDNAAPVNHDGLIQLPT